MVQISIPSIQQKLHKNGRYTVYCIELYLSGKCHKVDRRYSEFHELHRQLKKYFDDLPNLPPKKVRNQNQKLIEQRRTSLEEYLKNLLKNIGLDKSKEFNDFLNISSLTQSSVSNLNKKVDNQSKFIFKSNDTDENDYRNFNYHQCMINFKTNEHLFSTLDYDLHGSLYSDSSSTKSSNCETNSCTSTSSSTSGSLSDRLPDIVIIGSLDAIYDKSLKKF